MYILTYSSPGNPGSPLSLQLILFGLAVFRQFFEHSHTTVHDFVSAACCQTHKAELLIVASTINASSARPVVVDSVNIQTNAHPPHHLPTLPL